MDIERKIEGLRKRGNEMGEKEKLNMGMERGDRKREEKDRWRGPEGRDREQDKEGRSRRRDLFLIDLPRSPRPQSHVIIRRIFDLHSLWKGCVTSSTHSCDIQEVYFLSLTCK